jgi:hypothetical protein
LLMKVAWPGSIPGTPHDTDGVGHALAAGTMPPHLHDRANADIPPRGWRPADHEPRLVGDLVCRGPAPAPAGDSREVTGHIVARGYDAAPSGRPVIRGRGRCERDGERGNSQEPEMNK